MNLNWLVKWCNASYKQLKIPGRHAVAKLQNKLDALNLMEHHGDDLDIVLAQASRLLDELLQQTGIQNRPWRNKPSRNELPALALLPGIGIGIVYAYSSNGEWMLELENSNQRLANLPANALFRPLPVTAVEMPKETTAYDMFKRSIVKRKKLFMLSGVASLLTNTLALATSLYSMQVYDRVIPTQGISTLIALTIGVGISILLDFMVKLARSYIMDNSIRSMDMELSEEIFRRLLELRLDQYPSAVGSLSAQLRSYESIRQFASAATFYVAIDSPFALFFTGVIYLIAGPLLALIPFIAFLVSISVGLFFRKRILRHSESGIIAGNKKLGLLVEAVEGAEQIKANGAGWQILDRWNNLARQNIREEVTMRHFSETASFISAAIQQLSYVSLVATGAWITTTAGELTMGGLIACSILSGRVLAPVAALPNMIVQWAHSKISLKMINSMFALERDNHGMQNPLVPDGISGEYALEAIKCAYPDRPPFLAIPSLQIKAGQKVAVMGVIGTGKSTLLKILSGLFKPMEGRVMLDNLDIQQIAVHSLNEHIAYLPQDIRLVNGTLRDNVLSGLYGVDQNALIEAMKETGLDQLVANHPKGIDLEISEGGKGVSGGQRQQIMLTRLILSNPRIWLLDEPTATMDDGTEERVLKSLQTHIKPDHTLVLVTHKLPLLKLVDTIVVLTPRGIAMHGPRDQVLNKLMAAQRPAQMAESGD